MRSKYLFLTFAASAALVGCQNEELLTEKGTDANRKTINASKVSFAVSKDDAATRAIWSENEGAYTFNWTKGDGIGVAYIGDGGNEMESKGVTNYKFDVDSLKLASFKKKDNAKWTGFYQVDEALDDVKDRYTKADGTDLVASDLGQSETAKFKTPNDYIFEGYYAVYYPFDGTYTKKGYIPVKSPESIVIKNDLTDNLAAAAAGTFSYSKPQPFKAGKNVAEFQLSQLSGMMKLNLRNKTAAAISTAQKILIVPSKEFTVSGKLNSVDAAPSASVISDAKTASAMEVKFSSAAWDGTFAAAAVSLPVYTATPDNTVSVYLPMLPQSGFTGMDVYLINAEGAAIKVAKTANFSISSGRVQPVAIEIASSKFDTYIAYDAASFESVATNAPDGAIIEVLKPVTLNKAITVANKVTIQGKSITLDNSTAGKGTLAFTKETTVKSEIIANGGELTPTSATFGKLTVNSKKSLALEAGGTFEEIVNNGNLTLGDGTAAVSVNAGKVTNSGVLAIQDNAAINPQNSAIDNKGEVYQYVGSVIGAKGLTNASAATYTCEVVNQTKFDEAVARKATKIVLASTEEFAIPATGAENITIQFNKAATLLNQVKNEKDEVTGEVTGKVKAIESNCGEEKDASSKKIYPTISQNLTVTENITVKEDKYLKVAKNYTVNVTKKVILERKAKFEREQGGAADIEAKVNCSGIETDEGAQWIGGQPNF